MNAFKPLIPSFELMNRGGLAFRLPKKDIKGRKKEGKKRRNK
jgi:hypothetical protein|tara:strand:- start:5120 stop:5245 length:126 start_codon:yes stop_codon:yes gene_type:complete